MSIISSIQKHIKRVVTHRSGHSFSLLAGLGSAFAVLLLAVALHAVLSLVLLHVLCFVLHLLILVLIGCLIHFGVLPNQYLRCSAEIGYPVFLLLSFGLKINAARYPKKMAAVTPPALAVAPPRSAPTHPFSCTDSRTPLASV